MAKAKVAINGFGRIGRVFFRQAFDHPDLEVVAINDTNTTEGLIHLLKYDSTYGRYDKEVVQDGEDFVVDGKKIRAFTERDPLKLPWKDLGVDIVIEATGVFRTREDASKHIEAGAKKVIVTAPPKGELDNMIVLGVNEDTYDAANDNVISNASCTTNSLAPVAKVLNDVFGIKRGFMTTIHSVTSDQRLLDTPHSDLRRSRSAYESIIPTTTGAAAAVGKIIPQLEGKLTGLALRVPTATVSITDFVVELDKKVTAAEVNQALKDAAAGELKGILDVSDEPLVSIDYRGSDYSSIVDGLSTMVLGDNLVKILAWYDNEWGYSHRLVDLSALIARKMK